VVWRTETYTRSMLVAPGSIFQIGIPSLLICTATRHFLSTSHVPALWNGMLRCCGQIWSFSMKPTPRPRNAFCVSYWISTASSITSRALPVTPTRAFPVPTQVRFRVVPQISLARQSWLSEDWCEMSPAGGIPDAQECRDRTAVDDLEQLR